MNLDKSHVRRQFNRSAMQYDNVALMQRDIVDVLLRELPLALDSNRGNICDLGCGTGYGLSKLLASYPGSTLFGLDLAPAMLQATELRIGADNARLLQGDIEALPFAQNTMDLCISSSVIQWCDSVVAMNQVSNILKPGGTALVSSFLAGTLCNWRNLWGRNDQSFLSLIEFKQAIQRSDLILEKVWTEPYIQSFTSFDGALNSIRGLGAGNASASRLRGLTGRTKLKKIIGNVDHIIQRDGAIDMRYEVVYARAVKPLAKSGRASD